MTVRDIVREYLAAHGYDGLCGDGCGCDITDLAPCGGDMLDCKPAHKRACLGHLCQNKCEAFEDDPDDVIECYKSDDEFSNELSFAVADDAPVASDAREVAQDIVDDVTTEIQGAIGRTTRAIESFAADRERKAREETARKCAKLARDAILNFGKGDTISTWYSPMIRKDMAAQLAERAIMEAAHE